MSFVSPIIVRIYVLRRKLIENIPRILQIFFVFYLVLTFLVISVETYFLTTPKFDQMNPVPKVYNTTLQMTNYYPFSAFLHNKTSPVLFHKSDFYGSNGGITPFAKDARYDILCKLNVEPQCITNFIAETIDLFYVFSPIYSIIPEGSPVLYEFHVDFGNNLKTVGIKMVTIEAIFPDRKQKYNATKAGNEPFEIQVTLDEPFYARENLLNVAARKVPGWEYMSWIDAHQIFDNKYWWEEAIYKLEHYNVVQYFNWVVRIGSYNISFEGPTDPGILYVYSHTNLTRVYEYYDNIWAGNAYGIRRDVYEKLGRIMDECISGCCDIGYAIAAMKNMNDWKILDNWPNYKKQLMPWIEHAHKVFEGKWAVIRGNLSHLWHEHNFNYPKMLKAIRNGNYDATRDIERDENGTIRIKSKYLKELYAQNK